MSSIIGCDYRWVDNDDENRIRCKLVARILDRDTVATPSFDISVCEECCRCGLGDVAPKNPVIASLVNSIAVLELQPNSVPKSVKDRIDIHESQMYVQQDLIECITVESRSSDLLHANKAKIRPAAIWENVSAKIKSQLFFWGGYSKKYSIGLLGVGDGFGLASQNWDIARFLNVRKWMMPRGASNDFFHVNCPVTIANNPLTDEEIAEWLVGLDIVMFVESPISTDVLRVAHDLGKCIICIPNWEWIHPGLRWLPYVDWMFCPTVFTTEKLNHWKKRFDFRWGVKFLHWPIDSDRFAFRLRKNCQKFVYIHGSGGALAVSNANEQPLRRKGLDIVLEAAKIASDVPVLIIADSREVSAKSANVEVRSPPKDNRLLYVDGDVCIQPSRWEGLGLPLLECQSAGMPLLTTNASPMVEHNPLESINASTELACFNEDLWIESATSDANHLAVLLKKYHGKDIELSSFKARKFIEQYHQWSSSKRRITSLIQQAASISDSQRLIKN